MYHLALDEIRSVVDNVFDCDGHLSYESWSTA
jgi:hypothetical protein